MSELPTLGRYLDRVQQADPYRVGGRVAEVVGFRDSRTLLMPLGSMEGIRPGASIVASGRPLMAPAGAGLLGRVIDGLGRPIDGKGPLGPEVSLVSVDGRPPSPL